MIRKIEIIIKLRNEFPGGNPKKKDNYGEIELLRMDFHIDRNGGGFDGFIHPIDVLWRIQ